jgi:spermidine synthase
LTNSVIFRSGLAIALLSGAAGLSHELLWTRRLVDLLGGSSEANTRVLSLFFLGLSLGAVLAQWQLPRIRRPWLAAGITELLIAGLALPALALPWLTDWLWPALGLELLTGFTGKILKLLIAFGVIVPPATAMGVTLPLFVTGILSRRGNLGREGVWTYAINTVGGLMGLLLLGGLILPFMGVFSSMQLVVGLNFCLAIGCFTLDRFSRSPRAAWQQSFASVQADYKPVEMQADALGSSTQAVPVWFNPAVMAAFASGVGLLAAEIIALQSIMLVVPLSFFGPLAILATVVGLLAVAAPMVTLLLERSRHEAQWWLPRLLMVAGIMAAISPIAYMYFVTQIGMGPEATIFGFMLKVAFLVLVSFGPLFLVLGTIFPLSLVVYERTCGSLSHARWPVLLAANGLGGLIGAELAYQVAMPWFGVHTALGVVGLFYLLAAGLVWRSKLMPKVQPAILGGAVGVVLAILFGRLNSLPQINPYLPASLLSQRVGADGLVAVVEGEGIGRAILLSNQYILGSSSGQNRNRRQTHLPLLMHAQPQRVGFIGLATGITPGAALRHPTVESVVVAEISRGVVDAAQNFFSEFNDSITESSRVNLIVEDGRMVVAASPDQFDLLIGDLFLPWGAGASRLFSIEHFRAARSSLRGGGLFCQWLPLYQLTEQQFRVICHTFQQVFPTVHLFRNDADPLSPIVALIGYRDGDLSWDVIRQRCEQVFQEDRVQDPAMMHWQSVAMHYLGTLSASTSDIPPVSLNNLWIEIDASRHQVTGSPAENYLMGNNWMQYLSSKEQHGLQPSNDSVIEQYQRLGVSLVQWQWRKMVATSRQELWPDEEIRARLVGQFPSELLETIGRYPEAWPGNIQLFLR